MLEEALKNPATAKVIIIDDFYAGPNLKLIDSENLATLFSELEANLPRQQRLAAVLGCNSDDGLKVLMASVESNLKAVWGLFTAGDPQDEYLSALFSNVENEKLADRAPLAAIQSYFKHEWAIDTLHFGSLKEAEAALAGCLLAFIDFRLRPGISTEEALSEHAAFKAAYRSKLESKGTQHPKIVYLISSALPGTPEVERFRQVTGLRSAFFKTQPKAEVNHDYLGAELAKWIHRYSSAAQLDAYFVSVSRAVSDAASGLLETLDGLELHDLALLHYFKLKAESESLATYLNWLLSEVFAAKLKTHPALRAIVLPEELPLAPVDGHLRLGPTLFELFSQVTVSPVEAAGKPEFGSIYVSAAEANKVNAERKVLLAISPACDLIRCDKDYEVLCVKGTESPAKSDIDLLTPVKDGPFGRLSHIVQYRDNDRKHYASLRWDPKNSLRTILASDLEDSTKYVCVARLSELFAHEVKALAFEQASRIGIQTYPSFTLSIDTLVRARFGRFEYESNTNAQPFHGAVIVRGRTAKRDEERGSKADTQFVTLTEQFVVWMHTSFLPALLAKSKDEPPAMLKRAVEFFGRSTALNFVISGGKGSDCDGAVRVWVLDGITPLPNRTADCVELLLSFPKPKADCAAPLPGDGPGKPMGD